ncbi:hypothetical protein WN943_002518 [Citrus x changshan-huyou]
MSPVRGQLPQYIWQGPLRCFFALWGLSEYRVELSHCLGWFFDTAAMLCKSGRYSHLPSLLVLAKRGLGCLVAG